VRYVPWVAKVFGALAEVARGNLGGGVSLAAIGTALGFENLRYEDFIAGDGPARALMTAMYDLEKIGLVDFQNVDHGNSLTPRGRDLLDAGLASAWPEIFALGHDRATLAHRAHGRSRSCGRPSSTISRCPDAVLPSALPVAPPPSPHPPS